MNASSTLASTLASTSSTSSTQVSDELAQEVARLELAKQQAAMVRAAAAQGKVTPMTDSLAMNEELSLAGLGEELGRFKAYDSQLVIADIVGTRIIKCLYQKNPKTGNKAQENSYVRIPTKHLTEEYIVSKIAELSPYVLGWMQGIEEQIIREQHKKGALNVYTDGLGMDKLIAHLEESSEGSHLNKDKIDAWFIACVQDELTALFAAKMNLDENSSEAELEKLELVLGAYKLKFCSLAGGKAFIKVEDCIAMIAVIKQCEVATKSLLGIRFIARLEKMQIKKDDNLLSLL